MESKDLQVEQFVPVGIQISKANEFFHFINKNLFESEGSIIVWNPQKLFANPHDDQMPGKEFCDDLFEKMLEICSVEDAEALIEQLCEKDLLVFSFFEEEHSWHDNELYIEISRKELAEKLFFEMQKFKEVWDAYDAIQKALKNPEDYDLVHKAFSVGQTYGIGVTYDPFDKDASFDKIEILYHTSKCQYVAVSSLTYETIHDQWVMQGKKDISREKITEYILQQGLFDDMTSYARSFTSQQLNSKVRHVEVRQDTANQQVRFHCPTILSALYQKMLLCSYNHETYKKCKRCARYFKVDKHHPQSMCNIHMASRRRKRKHQRDKDLQRIRITIEHEKLHNISKKCDTVS